MFSRMYLFLFLWLICCNMYDDNGQLKVVFNITKLNLLLKYSVVLLRLYETSSVWIMDWILSNFYANEKEAKHFLPAKKLCWASWGPCGLKSYRIGAAEKRGIKWVRTVQLIKQYSPTHFILFTINMYFQISTFIFPIS